MEDGVLALELAEQPGFTTKWPDHIELQAAMLKFWRNMQFAKMTIRTTGAKLLEMLNPPKSERCIPFPSFWTNLGGLWGRSTKHLKLKYSYTILHQ